MILNNYQKIIMQEMVDFENTDFTSPDRPYVFNCIEEAIFKQRNGLNSVNSHDKPYSLLLMDLANQYQSSGSYSKAVECYERAVIWNPAAPRIEYLKLLLLLHDYETFEKNAKESFKYAYQDIESLYDVMLTYLQEIGVSQRESVTRDNIESWLKMHGFEIYPVDEIKEFLLNQGKIKETEGNREQAAEFYKAAEGLH